MGNERLRLEGAPLVTIDNPYWEAVEDKGHTGDDELRRMLETDWTEVDSRRPVQWWGVHDRVTVYERGESGD
ncbi:MAG: hypothetical protein QOD10_4044 [Mycobacterium sp.]|jgi:hypothetical protein|nr:hypothetical protein [Mycobacterium sp.]